MTQASNPRPAKKSETLEVRMSYPLKRAFADHCETQGVTLSEGVRGLIEADLSRRARRPFLNRERMFTMISKLKTRPRAAAATSLFTVAALSLGVAAPSVASNGREVFDDMDADGDGFVTRAEFVTAVTDHDHDLTVATDFGVQPVTRGQLIGGAHAEFERYDLNEDGAVSFDEFTGRYLARMRQAFAWLDENADGRLTAAELSTSLGGAGAPLAATVVEELDQDGDARLSYAEFIGHS